MPVDCVSPVRETTSWIERWLSLLRCPIHQVPLTADQDNHELCCSAGDHRFAIRDGILCFLDAAADSDPEFDIKQREIEARDRVAEGYTSSYSKMKNRLEMPPSLSAMSASSSDVVVELGCGTGRITAEYASKVARTVAMDFSFESLRSLREALPAAVRDSVLLIHGDICAPPLAAGSFTKVVSFQVLEHLPSPESRLAAMCAAVRLLSDDGDLVCTVYNWSEEKKKDARRGLGDDSQKQGFHDTGIFYYNFEEHELRQLFADAGLQMNVLEGVRIPVPGGRLLGPFILPVNRLLARTAYGIRNAHLLLGRGRKMPSRK